ncbi:MAG: DUF4153 domain-containing protein [Ruegeria sp.]
MGQFVVRGIPTSVLQDSWWLDSPGPQPKKPKGVSERYTYQAAGLLLALVALADFLMLGYSPGISLAVFALAVAVAVLWLTGRTRGLLKPLLLLGLSILPVVDYFQALSVAFLLGGSTVAFCWMLSDRFEASAVYQFLRMFPVLTIRNGFDLVKQARVIPQSEGAAFRMLRSWAFPVGGALVLASLMVTANPVLSDWLDHLVRIDLRLERVLFWVGAAFMIWPFLSVSVQPALLKPKMGPWRSRTRLRFGLNVQSVANAVILFNLMLGVQTGLDAFFLWGEADLPDGMTHAEYAHRGAYPLLATALLAGAFALVARPFLGERVGLTGWMMLWLGQNVLLVASSLLRLSLYVEAYGLTYLRVHAAIWMVLVAVGLILIAWQIVKVKSNAWLVTRTAALGISVLYACCFINFAALIARWNMEHPTRFDLYYACQLGPMAAAELAKDDALESCVRTPAIRNWREWGFRADRVIRNLHIERQAEAGHENPRRG